MESIAGMVGDLQAIAGKAMPEIALLDLSESQEDDKVREGDDE
jgi:hypothetical protein